MILTITMNPSVDISYPLNQLTINDINRVSDVNTSKKHWMTMAFYTTFMSRPMNQETALPFYMKEIKPKS